MSIWLKLLIPVLLGGGAATCNYFLMFTYTNPKKFVSAKEDINSGDELLSKLEVVDIPGRAQVLLKCAVTGDDYLSLLDGRRAARSLKKGDLLLWQDVVQPVELKPAPNEDALTLSLEGVAVIPQLLLVGQQITFVVKPAGDDVVVGPGSKPAGPREPELIGPFRLLSVGSRLNRVSADSERGDSSGRTITVAIPATSEKFVDATTGRLLKSIIGNNRDQSLIKAIILRHPEPDSESVIKSPES
jgi:hypothetical protein